MSCFASFQRAIPFSYNHIEELERIVSKNKHIGVIVIETMRHQEPTKGFLRKVRAIADRIGAALIFDEISIGWRLTAGGAHLLYKVHPDIAVFAKAMSNGFPCAAIIGKREVMQAAQKSFISSTYWTDRIGPAAALATIRTLIQKKVPKHLKRIGGQIGDGWKRLAKKHGLRITVVGPEALITFSFEYGTDSAALRTLFTQEMLALGFLAGGSVYVSFAHKPPSVQAYLLAVDEVFALLARAIREGTVKKRLHGPVAHSGFKRLT
ncbi:MAG: aminotransferase class III-fold pyridoxal phosphate-dependent enzyme [bacterium]|nr:aminotransferase class III-fold pyridoxal phosphate-dependent enzyme [bacterium]